MTDVRSSQDELSDEAEEKEALASPAPAASAEEAGATAEAEPSVPLEERVRHAVEGLFQRLGAELEVEVRETEETVDCLLRFGQKDAVLDVLPREELLDSAQYVLQRMVYRDADAGKRVTLEVGSAAVEADPAMEEMARRLAAAVQRMNRSVTIVPIHARDRKAIHQALADEASIATRSEGEGLLRRLVIEKK